MKLAPAFFMALVKRWVRADGFGLAASISFYTLFSFAPMIVFGLMIAGHFLGQEGARTAAADWLQTFLARREADSLITMVSAPRFRPQGWLFAAISGMTLAWAATLVFVRLRISVNRLLGYRSRSVKQAVRHSLWGRLAALVSTLIAGAVFVGGIVLTAAAPRVLGWVFPELAGWAGIGIHLINALLLFAALAAIMRYLAVHPPSWRAILMGCCFVILAFEVGRVLVNLYLARSQIASAYGAANTLVVFLLWIYYSSQMVLFGVALAGTIDETRDALDDDGNHEQSIR